MDILIKGIKMPDNCEGCFCYRRTDYDYSYCNISYVKPERGNTRPKECPLVPVPPHGRLIDADALLKVSEKRFGVINVGHIDDAPTIIPEEKGDL